MTLKDSANGLSTADSKTTLQHLMRLPVLVAAL